MSIVSTTGLTNDLVIQVSVHCFGGDLANNIIIPSASSWDFIAGMACTLVKLSKQTDDSGGLGI